MSYPDKTTLFIFLDESGDLNFTPSGTRYWSLSALCTFNPTLGRETFIDLRYKLADEGTCLECFHASEDRQSVRNEVFQRIQQLQDFDVHCVIANKPKANPVLYKCQIRKNGKFRTVKDESPFYDRVCRTLLKFVLKRQKYANAEKVIIVLSSIWNDERNKRIKQTLKNYLKTETTVPFEIYFHLNKADLNCQIADYCGWAIFIAWERDERRSLQLISRRVQSQFDIFATGQTVYYQK